MAWITRRVTSRGRVLLSVKWRDRLGRHRSKALGHGDPRRAEIERRAIEAGDEGKVVTASVDPLSLLEAFLKHKSLTRTPDTAQSYRTFLAPMVRAWLRVPLASWSRGMTEEYAREKREAKRRPWSGRACSIWLSGCREWIRWAQDFHAPLPDFVRGFRAWQHQRRTPRYLDRAQLDRLLLAARGHALEPMIGLCALAGMRQREAMSARVGDADFVRKEIVVRGTKGHADRIVDMHPRLSEILARVSPEDGYLCARVKHTSRYRWLDPLCDEAKVPRLSWHVLRHTFATALLSGGASLAVIQRLLGHTSGASTAIYTHASREDARSAVGRAF